MNPHRFEDLTRSLSGAPSRRNLLSGLVASALGLSATRFPDLANAKKKRKRKKHKKRTPKATPNEFGCLEVGDPCQSEDQCCSGICDGKRGKRTCRAHDTASCDQSRPGYCAEDNPYLATCNGGKGSCFRTTAGSNVCINNFEFADCQRDADCEALGYPAGASCAPIGGDLACAGLGESGMACVYLDSAAISAE